MPAKKEGRPLHWGAVLKAGRAAGGLFLGLEIVTGFFGAGTLLGPAHLTLREFLAVPPGEAGAEFVVLSVVLHLLLSVATGSVLLGVVHGWRADLALAIGLVYGVFLYTLNFVVFAAWLPGIEAGRGLFMALDYALFGAAVVGFYQVLGPPVRGAVEEAPPD